MDSVNAPAKFSKTQNKDPCQNDTGQSLSTGRLFRYYTSLVNERTGFENRSGQNPRPKSRLLLRRCLNRANLSASAAIYACFSIYHISSVVFANRGNRTFAFTGTTGDTFVGDTIRQTYHLLLHNDAHLSARQYYHIPRAIAIAYCGTLQIVAKKLQNCKKCNESITFSQEVFRGGAGSDEAAFPQRKELRPQMPAQQRFSVCACRRLQ